MPRIPRRKHTNFDSEILKNGVIGELDGFEIYREGEPLFKSKIDRQNNIIIGIAVGVMVVACSLISLVMFVNK